LALWKLINEEDAILMPKNRGDKLSSGFFYSEFFGGGVNSYAATPLMAAFSPGHCDITRIHLWSPIATGIYLDRPVKIPNFAKTTGTGEVLDKHSGVW
jgi:hypothetical protein